MLDHQRECLVVDQRGVLDRAHPRTHRPADPDRAVRVRGDERAEQLAFLHGRAQLVLGELRRAGVGTARQHGASCEHLDEVGAAPDDLTHVRPHLVDTARHAEPQLPRHDRVDVHGQAGQVAAAAGTGDIGARAEHAWPREPTLLDALADRDVGEGAE